MHLYLDTIKFNPFLEGRVFNEALTFFEFRLHVLYHNSLSIFIIVHSGPCGPCAFVCSLLASFNTSALFFGGFKGQCLSGTELWLWGRAFPAVEANFSELSRIFCTADP